MQGITGNALDVSVLDAVARLALGSATSGVSSSPNGTTIWLLNNDNPNPQIAQSIFDNFNLLLVSTNQNTIDANGIDTAIITHNTPDSSVHWQVYLDGVLYAEDDEIAIAGLVTLTLTTIIPGTYVVWIMRKTGNFATGFVQIVAQ